MVRQADGSKIQTDIHSSVTGMVQDRWLPPAFPVTRTVLKTGGTFLCLLLLCLAMPAVGVTDLDLSPPGKLVDLGTHHMHIYCTGEGSPTVILESGLGGFSLEWWQVQQQLAAQIRVCSYDRAGYGWSQSAPGERTSSRLAKELNQLLLRSGESPPYLIAAHSFGAYNAFHFADMYPQQVAGLVLLDPSHPQQAQRIPDVSIESRRKLPRVRRRLVSLLRDPGVLHGYPEPVRQVFVMLLHSRKSIRTQQREFLGFPRSASETARVYLQLPQQLPLVVLSRGRRVWDLTPLGNARERVWMEMQAELAHLTQNSHHIIAGRSGHMVHLDQPRLVVGAVRWVIRHGQPTVAGSRAECLPGAKTDAKLC